MADESVAPELIVEDLGLDQLAELGSSLAAEAKRVNRAKGLVDAEILRRMAAERQDMAITAGYTLRKVASRSYEWDISALMREFQPLVSPSIWDDCVSIEPPPPPKATVKVNTNKVLSTAKKLGARAELAVATCYRIDERAPRIEYEELPEEDRPL